MATIELTLPDQLAEEATRAGLLSATTLERILRAQLKSAHINELFQAMDRMAAQPEPAEMSPEEVAQEMAAMRAERRANLAA